MKGKKIVSMVLAVCLLMGMVPFAQAANAPKVMLKGGELSSDGTVTLTVSIEGNPGIAAYQLYFYYDTDVFEAMNVLAGESFLGKGSMLINSIALADERGVYDGKTGKDGMLAMWLNGRGEDMAVNGEMATITLKLKNGAAAGDYTIGLDYSKLNTINEKGETVMLNTVGTTVTVEGKGGTQKPAEPTKPVIPDAGEDEAVFDDIAGNWAEDYILKAAERGLVNGKKPGIFDPDANMTRAEFMTILWRAVGSPAPKGKASFADLPMEWYQAPIAWAEENQITNGTSPTTFDPNGNVTREQMMTILHRMAGKPIGMESLFTATYDRYFTDSASLSDWAKNAVYWSVFHEILCGEQTVQLGKVLAPRTAATRSQIAVSIIRYLDR